MKRMVFLTIAVILFNFINGIYAQDISLDYPGEVYVGQEFYLTVFLEDFEDDVYDIKIEIINGTKNIAQRLWEDEWKSTYYWMYEAINTSENNDKTFRLKITEDYKGAADINVKVKSDEFDDEFPQGEINILNDGSYEGSDSEDDGETDISLELDWYEEEIINGEEFEIELEAFDLKDETYDVKVWIEDDGNIISDRYDEENDEWESGNYYINNLFEGPGDVSEYVLLRIREDYQDFEGNARIYFKVRDETEINKKIEVLEEEYEEPEELEEEEILEEGENYVEENQEPAEITGDVIHLGKLEPETKTLESKNIKAKNPLIYESDNEIIKKYSVFGFALLCVAFSVLVIMKKL